MDLHHALDRAGSTILIGSLGYAAYGYLFFGSGQEREEKGVGSVLVLGTLVGLSLFGLSRLSGEQSK